MADKEKKKVPGRFTMQRVRLSFADSIFEAKSMKDDDGNDGPPKHHANFLLPKEGSPTTASNLAGLKKASDEARANSKWENKQLKLEPHKLCLRDGELKEYEGYAGNWYVSAGSDDKHPPKLIDHQLRKVTEEMGLLYSGCWVNATVRLWCQMHKKHGKRINATLEGIQFLEHDDAFGGAPLDVNEEFEVISETSGVVEGDIVNDDSGLI